jgi:hypothetical protein
MFELFAGFLFWRRDILDWNAYSGDLMTIGILFGFVCAFVSLVFPGPIPDSPQANKEVDEKSVS